jgi:hypothetical protein
MTIVASRRSFITGLVSLVAAPAIVRVASIMPVKNYQSIEDLIALRIEETAAIVNRNINTIMFGNPPMARMKFHGCDLVFDQLVPSDTVYLLTERAVKIAVPE